MLNKIKKTKWAEIVFFDGGYRDMENKAGILYNDTVEQLKGCGAAW
ncbi:hypothetical protein CASFOL_043065 [Castilleja foliolosa]|uniref:Uncharacterized protein n=1 Tax=Castilleja foliolosa TaxID=1961234 RepID=A0ABD3B840_9LAMI